MIQIREVTKKDLVDVFNLVKELAHFENALDQVSTHQSDYEKAFDQGLIHCLVAETEKNEIVGMTLSYMTFSTWKGRMLYLEDFVVKESFRGQGVGRLLFKELVRHAKEENVALIKWQVLDWNQPAINFYKQNEAEVDTEWYNCKLYKNKFDQVIESP